MSGVHRPLLAPWQQVRSLLPCRGLRFRDRQAAYLYGRQQTHSLRHGGHLPEAERLRVPARPARGSPDDGGSGVRRPLRSGVQRLVAVRRTPLIPTDN